MLPTDLSPTRPARRRAVLPACILGLFLAACVSPPETTAKRANEHALEELAEIVTASGAQPIETSSDVLTVGPESPEEDASTPESEADEPAPTEAELAGHLAQKLPKPKRHRKNPYLLFGERIVVHPDGRISKPYPLPPGKGKRMLDLMLLMAGQGLFSVQVVDPAKPGEVNPDVIQAVLLENWDVELYQNLRQFPPVDRETPTADWLVCTARAELLEEVEYFVDLFGAGVPQFEIEAKIVELTETDVLDWGAASASATLPANTLIDSVSFAFPNAESANEAILSLGAIQDGVTVDAILQAVKTWENVSIISQPKIAVREGGKAEILNTEELPFFNVKSISDTGTFNATLDFKEVGVRLYIVPRIVGSETLALNIDLEASQEAGSLTTVVAGTGPNAADLQTPIIAKRSVNTIVYLKKGQALILGGLTTTRTREVEKKLPFLGDVPLLGWLFKSKFNQVTRSHVLFFIRPRILEGTDFQRDF